MIQQALTCIKSTLFYIRFLNGIFFKDYQMLRPFTVIVLSLLAACNPFNTDDDSSVILEGSDPNGSSITFVSENGYHAIKVNSSKWEQIINKITLSKLSSSDTIEFIELCEPDEAFPRGKGVSFKFRANNVPKSGKGNNIYSCDTSHLLPQDHLPKSAIIYSEQSNDGINIINGTITDVYIDFDTSTPKIKGASQKVENSILLVGKNNRDDSYYVYRDDKFTYENGEDISIDFYSESAMKIELIDEVTAGEFEYSRTYSDDSKRLWINLSYEDNSIHLTIPDNFRRPQDVYNERWSKYSSNNFISADYSTTSKTIQKINFLENIWQTIEKITVNESDNQYGSIELPDNVLFTSNNLLRNTFFYYKGNIIIQSFDFTIAAENLINNDIIKLSSLPNVPRYFNLTIEDLDSSTLILSVFDNHENGKTERLDLQRYFKINQDN